MNMDYVSRRSRMTVYNTKTGNHEDFEGVRLYATPEDIESFIKTKLQDAMQDRKIVVTDFRWDWDTDGRIEAEFALLREDQSIKW